MRDKVNLSQYNKMCMGKRNSTPRLCGFLDGLEEHMSSVTRVTYDMICEVCGKNVIKNVQFVELQCTSFRLEESLRALLVSSSIIANLILVYVGQIRNGKEHQKVTGNHHRKCKFRKILLT